MDNKNSYIVREENNSGNVYLAEDVVAMIAGLAAIRDVDGVTAVGDAGKKNLASHNVKKAARGVRVDITDGIVNVDISLAIAYGFNIPETCRKVQQKVQSNIENMTGLKVAGVNLRIAGLNMD